MCHTTFKAKVGSKAIEGKDPRPSRDSDYYRKGDGGRGKGAKLLLFRLERGEKGKGKKGKKENQLDPFPFPLPQLPTPRKIPMSVSEGSESLSHAPWRDIGQLRKKGGEKSFLGRVARKRWRRRRQTPPFYTTFGKGGRGRGDLLGKRGLI